MSEKQPEMTPDEIVGRTIRMYMAGARHSHGSLSEATGIPVTSLSRTTRGQRSIAVSDLKRIAKALNVRVAQLIEGLDDD